MDGGWEYEWVDVNPMVGLHGGLQTRRMDDSRRFRDQTAQRPLWTAVRLVSRGRADFFYRARVKRSILVCMKLCTSMNKVATLVAVEYNVHADNMPRSFCSDKLIKKATRVFLVVAAQETIER